MSPQVVTESLYALACSGGPDAFVPTELRIISTRAGARQAELALLAPDTDHFGQLCRDYGLRDIRFDVADIHVIRDADGRLLDDIRTPEDNMAAADFISEQVAGLCRDPDCALHVSIAGGRKSMGFFVGYALSLFGRAQDRLSHVLVSEGFESHPEFFYIPRKPETLLDRNGRQMSTVDAQIHLADIPVVSLRHGVPESLLNGQAGYRETVKCLQYSQSEQTLRLDVRRHSLHWGDQQVTLKPLDFLVYAFLCWRRKQGLLHGGAFSQNAFRQDASARRAMHAFAVQAFGEMSAVVGSLENKFRDRGGIEQELLPDDGWLQQRMSRIGKVLREGLDPIALSRLGIQRSMPEGRAGGTYYATALAGHQIAFENLLGGRD